MVTVTSFMLFPGGEFEMRETLKEKRSMKETRGLVLVFTGEGKGKTTAALGLAVRMIKHGKRVAMVQFFKPNGRHIFPKANFKVWSFGGGFTWNTSRAVNQKSVDQAWRKCLELLKDSKYQLIILDEIHIAIRHKFLRGANVIKALRERASATHVVLTGRGAPATLIRYADLATEMKCLKHPFSKGFPAWRGLDF